MTTWAYVRGVLKNEIILGSTPGVGRLFMACDMCGRIVPLWRLVATADRKKSYRMGCKCGSGQMRFTWVPFWKGLSILTGAYLWRRVILRYKNWDPRIPCQNG